MRSRPFRFVPFAVLLCLSGCWVAARVQSAFEMPVAAPVRPLSNRSARQAREFDSLSRSLQKLDRTTFDTLIKRWQSPAKGDSPSPGFPSAPQRAAFLPSSWNDPAFFQKQQPVPFPLVLPARVGAGAFSALSLAPGFSMENGAAPIEFVSGRTLRADPPPSNSASTSADVRAFLSGWAARQSLARADVEFLERRALQERIALLSHAPVAGVDLSLVSPAVQLELTNLRLELVPLLASSPAQKAQAQKRIDAIEARLRQIWESETARQAQVRRQTLEEVPARLAREGEAALRVSTQKQALLDQSQRAQVQEAQARARPFALPSLIVRQSAAIAPDAQQVRGLLQTPVAALSSRPQPIAPLPPDTAPLATSPKSAIPSASSARLSEQQAQVWRAAIR